LTGLALIEVADGCYWRTLSSSDTGRVKGAAVVDQAVKSLISIFNLLRVGLIMPPDPINDKFILILSWFKAYFSEEVTIFLFVA